MTRRYGAFDANIKNVLMSFIGNPPLNRPVHKITPELNYHFEHLGFDHRSFLTTLEKYFTLLNITSSPFSFLGSGLMPEIYYKVEKTKSHL
jgi:hypothetical protein